MDVQRFQNRTSAAMRSPIVKVGVWPGGKGSRSAKAVDILAPMVRHMATVIVANEHFHMAAICPVLAQKK